MWWSDRSMNWFSLNAQFLYEQTEEFHHLVERQYINMIPLCYILNILMYPFANHGILSQCPSYFKIEDEANCTENPVSSILHILNSLQNWLLNIAAVGGRVINEASGKPPRKWASAETIDTELWSKHLKCKCPFHSNSASRGCISAAGSLQVHTVHLYDVGIT